MLGNLHVIKYGYGIAVQSASLTGFGNLCHLFCQTQVECFRNLLWFTYTATLDDDIVKLLHLGKLDQLFEEVTAQCAADAAILQRNDLLASLRDAMHLLDERRVDIYTVLEVRHMYRHLNQGRLDIHIRPNVVDNNRNPESMFASEDML